MIDLFGLPPATWLPFVFATVMAAAVLAYVMLDGYDLGVGMIMATGDRAERDRMISSIIPFWDVNEVWLVLGVGVLLVAFPKAHGVVLTALYLPCAIMLTGLILRGVAFKFRTKAPKPLQRAWDWAFIAGSAVTALSQGYMMGRYVLGFRTDDWSYVFALVAAFGLAIAYIFIGATWLIYKTEGELRERAIRVAQLSLFAVVASLIAVSLATPLVSQRIFERWFSFPSMLLLAPLPLITGAVLVWLHRLLATPWQTSSRADLKPFLGGLALFGLGFAGLAYSFYPFIVPERLTIYDAASAPESLWFTFLGVCVVLPIMIASSIYTYWVFGGKSGELEY